MLEFSPCAFGNHAELRYNGYTLFTGFTITVS